MKSGKNAWLSRIFTILLLPLVVGGTVYLVFEAFQSAYTSEAQIQVNEALWLDPYRDSTRLINEYTLNRRVQEIIKQISSDHALLLLSYRLGIHDLGQDPFLKHKFLDDMDAESRLQWSRKMQKRLVYFDLELGQGSEDQEIKKILDKMRYLPPRLREELKATQVPGTSLIQVQGNGRSPEMSGFMVNAFCDEFIRYVSQVQTERLQDMLMVVDRMVEKKEEELQDHIAYLGEKQSAVSDAIDSELWDLKRRINRLENTRLQEERQILELRQRLEEKKSESQTQISRSDSQEDIYLKVNQDLEVELEESKNRLEVIDRQLGVLRKKLEEREKNILQPFKSSTDSIRSSLALLEKDREKIKQALNYTDKLLIQVIKGKTRHPSPFTSLFLALQAGIATLLLWLIFLHQANFIHLFKVRAKEG